MFPPVEIFSVIFKNYGEVKVFQKIVSILLFTLFIFPQSSPLNSSHSHVPDSPTFFGTHYLFHRTWKSVFSSFLVPFRFWGGKQRMNSGSVFGLVEKREGQWPFPDGIWCSPKFINSTQFIIITMNFLPIMISSLLEKCNLHLLTRL